MKHIVIFSMICLLIVFGGCSSGASSANSHQNTDSRSASEKSTNTEQDAGSSATKAGTDIGSSNPSDGQTISSETNTDSSTAGTDDQDHQSESESDHNHPFISTGTSAAEYLKHQLKMDGNSDIEFDDMGGSPTTDKTGSYYTIKLISKSAREKGGTGTAGIYKVYQDGTYKLQN